jgi:hypothetical protein
LLILFFTSASVPPSIFTMLPLTESFDIKTWVKQGCLLSPFLFLLAIDYIMRESTEGKWNGIQWTMWQQLDDLDFTVHDRSFLKPACCSLSFSSTAFNSLVRSILFSTFASTDNSAIHL